LWRKQYNCGDGGRERKRKLRRRRRRRRRENKILEEEIEPVMRKLAYC